ncbi:hypothetical protein HDU76_009436 [Blyttiomyces sp. JEL0837]|nr:hypothetical protein HDU76_009436 [Blyttiomyces sp. JEL0837]
MTEIRAKAQVAELAYCANFPSLLPFNCLVCNGPALYLQNWVAAGEFAFTNMNLPNTPSGIKVHDGFYYAYMSFRNYIMGNITAMAKKYPTYELQATGHSFGCVLSSFTVADVALQKVIAPSKISLTGFGCPRVGSYEYARLIDTQLGLKSVRRVIHSSDMIVHYPPAVGYRHFGTEYWLNMDSKQTYKCIDTNTNIDESLSCSNSVPKLSWSQNPHNSYCSLKHETACAVKGAANSGLTAEFVPYQVYTTRP